MSSYKLSHLKQLEAEAIFVMREAAAGFEKPVLLFSGGKDSIVMVHLARKAFYPGKIPFPLMHVDTGHNFPETMQFRDDLVAEIGVELVIASVQDCIDQGLFSEESGFNASRNSLQTFALLKWLEEGKYDAALGGARRDEEKARAKERFFSHRDEFGQWNPKNQRPELWNLFNMKKKTGEHFRIFPISNFTEMDIWQYIALENIRLPGLYFAHKRMVFERDGIWYADTEFITKKENEVSEERVVRFRTIGDATISGATNSTAATLEDIINEVAAAKVTERGGRADDKRSEAAMDERKKQGYF